jgi:Skp family chaperone for outer membrane proteins
MKHNVTWLSITAAPLILGCLLGLQADRPEIKIGVVNFRQLLLESPDLQSAMDTLKAQFEPRRQELLKMQREAKDHPNEKTLQKDFAAQAGDFQDRASASRSAAVEKVSRSIADTIREYAKNQNIDVVAGDTPLFADPPLQSAAKPIDITVNVQTYMAHPAVIPTAPSDIAAVPSVVKLGLVKGLDDVASTNAAIRRIQQYASMQGYALVIGTIYYSKPQFKLTDITVDVRTELKRP